MLKRGLAQIFHYLYLAGDTLAVAGALTAAYVLRFSGWPVPLMHDVPAIHIYFKALPVAILSVMMAYHYAGLYLARRGISGVDEFSKTVRATSVAFLFLIGLTYFSQRVTYSRVVLIYAWIFTILLATGVRVLLRKVQAGLRRRGMGVSRVLLVGLTPSAKTVVERIRRHPGLGYRLLGMVAEAGKPPKTFEGLPVLGTLAKLPAIIKEEQADEVIFSLPPGCHAQLETMLLEIEPTGVECRIVSDLFGIITNPLAIDQIHGIPLFALKEAPLSKLSARMLKRTLDLVLTIPGTILLSPLLLLLAAAVRLSSPGPVLFKQERVGRDNHTFLVLKFRSMRMDAEKESGPVWATKGDSRTTRLGAFMRRTSLDELPQLFNVLKGEMSLVGPRPERPHFVNQFKATIPRYLERHKAKAGLTGWAQIHGLRGDTPIDERTKYDLWYVENWSLVLDIKILIRTVLDVFHHADAY